MQQLVCRGDAGASRSDGGCPIVCAGDAGVLRDRIDHAVTCAERMFTVATGRWSSRTTFRSRLSLRAVTEWLTARRNSLDQLEPYTALLRLSDEASALGSGQFWQSRVDGGAACTRSGKTPIC